MAAKYLHCRQTPGVIHIALVVRPHVKCSAEVAFRRKTLERGGATRRCVNRHASRGHRTPKVAGTDFDCALGGRGSRPADVTQRDFHPTRKKRSPAHRPGFLSPSAWPSGFALAPLESRDSTTGWPYSLLTGVLDVATTCHLPPFRDHTCRLWCASSPFVPCVMSAVSALRNVTL